MILQPCCVLSRLRAVAPLLIAPLLGLCCFAGGACIGCHYVAGWIDSIAGFSQCLVTKAPVTQTYGQGACAQGRPKRQPARSARMMSGQISPPECRTPGTATRLHAISRAVWPCFCETADSTSSQPLTDHHCANHQHQRSPDTASVIGVDVLPSQKKKQDSVIHAKLSQLSMERRLQIIIYCSTHGSPLYTCSFLRLCRWALAIMLAACMPDETLCSGTAAAARSSCPPAAPPRAAVVPVRARVPGGCHRPSPPGPTRTTAGRLHQSWRSPLAAPQRAGSGGRPTRSAAAAAMTSGRPKWGGAREQRFGRGGRGKRGGRSLAWQCGACQPLGSGAREHSAPAVGARERAAFSDDASGAALAAAWGGQQRGALRGERQERRRRPAFARLAPGRAGRRPPPGKHERTAGAAARARRGPCRRWSVQRAATMR